MFVKVIIQKCAIQMKESGIGEGFFFKLLWKRVVGILHQTKDALFLFAVPEQDTQ